LLREGRDDLRAVVLISAMFLAGFDPLMAIVKRPPM